MRQNGRDVGNLPDILGIHLAPSITLPCQSENCVRAYPDRAVRAAIDVNSEKREARAGNRVDQPSASRAHFRCQHEVVPAKRNDCHAIRIGARVSRQTVRMDPRRR